MLKRFLIGILLVCIVLSISSCTGNDTTTTTSKDPTPTTNPNDTPIQLAPELFASFEAFEQHEKGLGEKALSHYFVPAELSDEYEFFNITKRENVYVAVHYKVTEKISSSEKLNSYELERLSTLICKYELFTTDPQYTIEKSYIKNGYKAFEYKGKTYYRHDEYSTDNPDRLLGYGIVFTVDDCLIYMHLPAIDTFENMMQFANLQKVTIK
jgi:hypothetical protein